MVLKLSHVMRLWNAPYIDSQVESMLLFKHKRLPEILDDFSWMSLFRINEELCSTIKWKYMVICCVTRVTGMNLLMAIRLFFKTNDCVVKKQHCEWKFQRDSEDFPRNLTIWVRCHTRLRGDRHSQGPQINYVQIELCWSIVHMQFHSKFSYLLQQCDFILIHNLYWLLRNYFALSLLTTVKGPNPMFEDHSRVIWY